MFQALLGRPLHSCPVGPVKGFADFAADIGTGKRSDGNGCDFAGPFAANCIADNRAADGAQNHTGILLALARAQKQRGKQNCSYLPKIHGLPDFLFVEAALVWQNSNVRSQMKTAENHIPFDRFGNWFEKAEKSEPDDHNAFALATATPDGCPSVRMVLLKDWGQDGFVFYTNYDSRKGGELESNAHAAMLFHWKSLRRQIRIEGSVEKVTGVEADAYFSTRPRDSQIGAWASQQSRPMEGRLTFEAAIAKIAAKYAVGKIPRPPRWSGFRIKPQVMEFWTNKKFRLHEREQFIRDGSGWTVRMLYP